MKRAITSTLLVSLTPLFVFAAEGGDAGGSSAGGGDSKTLLDEGLSGLQKLACKVFEWVYTFAIIVGVIFIVLAAIQYMSAGENSEQVKKAHASLRNAIIGIAVAIIAWGAPSIIGSFLEVKGTDFGNACTY